MSAVQLSMVFPVPPEEEPRFQRLVGRMADELAVMRRRIEREELAAGVR